MDFKDLLTITGVVLSIVAPFPYIRDILRHKTKPHPITWLIWTLLAGSAALVQWISGGGLASLVLAFTALMNVVILVLSVRQTAFKASSFDKIILVLAISSLLAGRLTGSPDLTAVLLTFTMFMGYIPTFRKSIATPQHETISLYVLSGIKQLVGIIALSAYNIATLLFPAVLVLANFGLVVLLITRRRIIKI